MRPTKFCAFLMLLTGVLPATAQADSWKATTPLTELLGPSLALLPNGKVFATGNQFASTDARSELYDPATGIWSAATTQAIGDVALLGDGTVLIAGASPQVYDPATNTVAPARPLFPNFPIQLSTAMKAVPLDDGTALVAGDLKNNVPSGAVAHYRPADPDVPWTITSDVVKRWDMTLTKLRDGTVLAVGGTTQGGGPTASAGIYESSDRWSPTNPMISTRDGHTATLLADGRVLVAGGRTTTGSATPTVTATAEIYTPATGQWAPARAMTVAREDATATLLLNGKVLVAGGTDGTKVLSKSELYDPATNTWTAGPEMTEEVKRHAALLLPSGQVLVVGGVGPGAFTFADAEIYTPDAPPAGGPGGAGGTTGGGTGTGAAGGGTAGGPAPRAAGAPALSAPRLSASRFRASRRGGMLTPGALGARVVYTDSQAAITTFTVLRVSSGRRAGARCVAPGRAPRGAARCVRLTALASATHQDQPGPNTVTFSGRIRGAKLAAGTYRLSLVARAAGGATSTTRTVAFTIVR